MELVEGVENLDLVEESLEGKAVVTLEAKQEENWFSTQNHHEKS